MQNTYERLAFSVRTARKRENITQAELAERLKMSIRTIQGIENCKGNPKFETIILLCRELNVSLDAVLYPDIPAAICGGIGLVLAAVGIFRGEK